MNATDEQKPTCDNCKNDIEVELNLEEMAFWCKPCRWAKETPGQEAYFEMRREWL